MSTLRTPLQIPDSLSPERSPELQLPVLLPDTRDTIERLGWAGVGVMVALVTEASEVMLLVGRETLKYRSGTLGPLGETTKHIEGRDGIPPLVEQPLSTLHRGFSEELGVADPELLGLKMASVQAWRVNHWPRGDAYPGQFNCAISFAVHLPKAAEELLHDINPRNDEVTGVSVQSIDEILKGNPLDYRQGVQSWLTQLHVSGLLSVDHSKLQEIDFGPILFGSKDIQI